jgi:mRNA-degrading endonuclease YafQ of YafQ-DinJ toxin-antitoxin module
MSKLPWFLTAMLSIIAAFGWKKALAKDAKEQLQIETRKEIVREIISKQDLEFPTQSKDEELVSSFAQDCLDNPDVQSKIDRKAKR